MKNLARRVSTATAMVFAERYCEMLAPLVSRDESGAWRVEGDPRSFGSEVAAYAAADAIVAETLSAKKVY